MPEPEDVTQYIAPQGTRFQFALLESEVQVFPAPDREHPTYGDLIAFAEYIEALLEQFFGPILLRQHVAHELLVSEKQIRIAALVGAVVRFPDESVTI